MATINSYNVCFLGRTGNGKSSLINEIWGTHFPTDPLLSCTKEMQTVTKMEDIVPGYDAVCIYDTPGIGEFSSLACYEKYYEHAVTTADCIVLVTTFDRTDAPAQRLLLRMKEFVNANKNVKFIIALNHIDSRIVAGKDNTYEPWDAKNNAPSAKCMENIEARIKLIHERYDNKFLPFQVVPVCALRRYGIEALKAAIIKSK